MFYLLNLSSTAVQTGVAPWDFKPATPIPDEVRRDKLKRDSWITNPKTSHYVYSLYEGLNGGLRVSKPRNDGEGNPVVKANGFCADYDSSETEEKVLEYARKLPFAPNWIEKTLSGNWRFVWLFEEAINIPSYEFWLHFLAKFITGFGFRVDLGMLGFDKGAWNDPCRMFTNSCDWRPCRTTPIPKEIVRGWLVQASASFEWTDKAMGVSIPLDVVKTELQKKFPRFNQWPGDFALGEQGPSFWIDGSTSPKSAIIRETGIQSFSSHATKAFYSWSDLLGGHFVKQYQTEAVGRAVDGIYYDGKSYHRQIANKSWKAFEKGDVSLHLRTSRGISPKADKTGTSDVDRCLEFVQNHQNVSGCAPFVCRPSGPVTVNGTVYLNTSTRNVLTPAEGVAVRGDSGQFPWLSKYLHCFFDPYEQLAYFLAWLSLFYSSSYHKKPVNGQNVFIAGGTGVGKTLLGTCILAMLMGGFAEANDYLLGKDNFGSELFEHALWTVDDSTSTVDRNAHKHFSEMIKRMAANQTFRFHAKFRVPSMVEWLGRVIVTLNRDSESLRILPDIDISILEKLMIFKTADESGIVFPPQTELKEILNRELPWFARWLLDHKIPAELVGTARYGVKPYAEPSLVDSARQSSNVNAFAEILEDFVTEHFKIKNQKALSWVGTSYQLHKAILSDPSSEAAMRAFTVDAVGRHLSSLEKSGFKVRSFQQGTSRKWEIFPDTFETKNKETK